MNPIRQTEFRTASDAALQIDLERQLAKLARAEREMDARYYAVKVQPEPVCFCADCVYDSDPPLGWMLLWTALAIPCWLVSGWCVVTVVRWFA